jgi:hypothetical protein
MALEAVIFENRVNYAFEGGMGGLNRNRAPKGNHRKRQGRKEQPEFSAIERINRHIPFASFSRVDSAKETVRKNRPSSRVRSDLHELSERSAIARLTAAGRQPRRVESAGARTSSRLP